MVLSTRHAIRYSVIHFGLVMAALITISGSTITTAGDLNPAHVPADAQWLVHVDYESLSESAIWQKISEEKPVVSKMAQGWMKNRYGIDPSTELKSLTMFSRDYREYTGTVIVKADYDASRIDKRLASAMNHRTTKWKEHTLHTITLSKQDPGDDGPSGDEEMTVVMVDKNTILLASSVPNAEENLRRMAGELSSLKDEKSALLTEDIAQAWIYGAAINLGKLEDHPVSMPIIAQHQQITWSLGEQDDGQLYEKATLEAQSEEVAKRMKTVFDGIVAFESLRAKDSESMTALMKNVRVERQGNTTTFQWSGESDQVVDALDDMFARLKTWKPLLMHRKSKEQPTE